MKDRAKNDLILLSHQDVSDAAKRDRQLLASAATQMDAALAQLPRALHWSIQPINVFKPVAAHHNCD